MDLQPAVFPLYYLPPIHVVKRMLEYGEICFDPDELFIKQTFRNRCSLLTANGVLQLSIPIQSGRSKQALRDTRISYAENWTRVHTHAITSAYRKSAYFYLFEEELLGIYERRPAFLADLNLELLRFVMRTLQGVSTPVVAVRKEAGAVRFGDRDLLQTASPLPVYGQVFEDRFDFIPGLSILDILCNEIYYFEQL